MNPKRGVPISIPSQNSTLSNQENFCISMCTNVQRIELLPNSGGQKKITQKISVVEVRKPFDERFIYIDRFSLVVIFLDKLSSYYSNVVSIPLVITF